MPQLPVLHCPPSPLHPPFPSLPPASASCIANALASSPLGCAELRGAGMGHTCTVGVAQPQPPPRPWSLGTASRERTNSPSAAMRSPSPAPVSRAARTGRGLRGRTRTHLHLAALPQVEGQVLVDVRREFAGILGVELQHLAEPPQPNVLQVAVGQRLHVCVGLDHLVRAAQVGSDQIPFACRRGPGWASSTSPGPLTRPGSRRGWGRAHTACPHPGWPGPRCPSAPRGSRSRRSSWPAAHRPGAAGTPPGRRTRS